MSGIGPPAHEKSDEIGDVISHEAGSSALGRVGTALNLTFKLKQDPETLARLDGLAKAFPTEAQPLIDRVLAESRWVHFVRVFVIDNTYLQVLTEFDGDPLAHTSFLLEKLGPIFEPIFSLVEGAPPWGELQEPIRFFEFTLSNNARPLGESRDS
jgi:hypothetical protein